MRPGEGEFRHGSAADQGQGTGYLSFPTSSAPLQCGWGGRVCEESSSNACPPHGLTGGGQAAPLKLASDAGFLPVAPASYLNGLWTASSTLAGAKAICDVQGVVELMVRCAGEIALLHFRPQDGRI